MPGRLHANVHGIKLFVLAAEATIIIFLLLFQPNHCYLF